MTEAPLYVYHGENEIGRIALDLEGRFVFNYCSEWLDHPSSFPISLSMPFGKERYGKEAQAYFSNILPEGALRTLICQRLKISEANDYELLKKIGGECAGAIRILEEDSDVTVNDNSYMPLDELSSVEVMMRDQAYGNRENRLSLAGAQYKLPVYYDGKLLYLPQRGAPSSHIIKFPTLAYKDLPTVEILSTFLGQKLELNTIHIDAIAYENKKTASLSKRYDRLYSDGKIIRMHQEDFCQILGKHPYQKYEVENGPSLKDCFQVVEQYSTVPVIDKKSLLQSVILNVLIGNCDAHGKNISFIYSDGQVKLSPSYDIVSTLMYPKVSTQLAMSIGGEKEVTKIRKLNWNILSDQIHIGSKYILGMVEEMGTAITDHGSDWLQELESDLPEQHIIRFYRRISKQCKNILQKL
jgi:serine/threonine-protein kinase HipA